MNGLRNNYFVITNLEDFTVVLSLKDNGKSFYKTACLCFP